jgi:hypothetical protein
MKTVTLLFACIASFLFADANTDWVDAQIKAIKPDRVGVAKTAINSTKNPFLYQYKKQEGTAKKGTKKSASSASKSSTPKTAAKRPLQLYAVMNNSVLINGSWYKTSETVQGYIVSTINADSVLLKKGTSKKMLFVTDENKNIKIQVK